MKLFEFIEKLILQISWKKLQNQTNFDSKLHLKQFMCSSQSLPRFQEQSNYYQANIPPYIIQKIIQFIAMF